ncbi:MAG: terminase small subunit [Oscillospiraceae bacterium]|jgi:hypothetical protein
MGNRSREQEETLFCTLYHTLGNAREAAAQSGYTGYSGVQYALRMLENERAAKRLKALKPPRGSYIDDVCSGLKRLAFSPVNDAVRLALCGRELSGLELEQLDLFCISEFKLSDKGVELKFFDRQKAFELLYTIASSADAEQRGRSFYDALEESAALLRGAQKT